jgi:ADP-ribose pyrophosphatase
MDVVITNMVMIHDKITNKVLVQNRIKSWKGIAFPGGHLEAGESVYDSAVREIKEETGLDITDLQYCGMVHWCYNNHKNHELIYYYKTDKFSGELIADNEEGQNFWVDLDKVSELKLSPGFDKQLDLFFNDCSELFILRNDETNEVTHKWY